MDKGNKAADTIIENKEITRRNFLKVIGVFSVGTGILPEIISCSKPGPGKYPVSMGYILVDTKKCQGCVACMLACSTVHEGSINLSRSRIQVMQNSFGNWPSDVSISQCRQCKEPQCVLACPSKAMHVDTENGNVRLVNRTRCIGCGRCIAACPYEPRKPILRPGKENENGDKAVKCDLCVNTPYHWESCGGGPEGKQACVEVCPVGAISFTSIMPLQSDDSGYDVNLRNLDWGLIGYPWFFD